jgi:hypothetical protein
VRWGRFFSAGFKALIVANHFLETDLWRKAAVSTGYARGMLPRDRKDWYD